MPFNIRALLLLIICSNPNAFEQPRNYFAVFLNNGETIDFDVFTKKGDEGVNYFVWHSDGITRYVYRSHYRSFVLIQLNDHPQINGYSLFFVVDTTTFKPHSFLFDSCVGAELDWLVQAGVLSMDKIDRERTQNSFSSVETGGYNYWTMQDTLLDAGYCFDKGVKLRAADCCSSGYSKIALPLDSLLLAMDLKRDNREFTFPKPSNTSIIPVKSRIEFTDILGRRFTHKQKPVTSTAVLFICDPKSGNISKVLSIPR